MEPIVFLDLDCVLTDWYGSVIELAGLSRQDPAIRARVLEEGINWMFEGRGKAKEVGRQRLIERVAEQGYDFWIDLQPLPWAQTLFDFTRYHADQVGGRVVIASSPGDWPGICEGAKFDWLRNQFGVECELVTIRNKEILAAPNRLLIDDYPRNLQAFRDAGGQVVYWSHPYALMDAPPDRLFADLRAVEDAIKYLAAPLAEDAA